MSAVTSRNKKGMILFEILIAMVVLAIFMTGIYRRAMSEKGSVSAMEDIAGQSELVQYRTMVFKKIRAELSCNQDLCTALSLPLSANGQLGASFDSGYPLFDEVTGIVHANFIITKGGNTVASVPYQY